MSARGGVDKDEVAGEQGSEDKKEVEGSGRDQRDESGEEKRDDAKGEKEGAAVAMVKEVTMLEAGADRGLAVKRLRVKQAIRGVEDPDHEEHGDERGGGKVDLADAGDEGGPDRGDGWGVE